MTKISKIKKARNIRQNSEEIKNKVQKRIWRQLQANARMNKRLQKQPFMKKVLKHRARRNPKYLGFSQINYESFLRG